MRGHTLNKVQSGKEENLFLFLPSLPFEKKSTCFVPTFALDTNLALLLTRTAVSRPTERQGTPSERKTHSKKKNDEKKSCRHPFHDSLGSPHRPFLRRLALGLLSAAGVQIRNTTTQTISGAFRAGGRRHAYPTAFHCPLLLLILATLLSLLSNSSAAPQHTTIKYASAGPQGGSVSRSA